MQGGRSPGPPSGPALSAPHAAPTWACPHSRLPADRPPLPTSMSVFPQEQGLLDVETEAAQVPKGLRAPRTQGRGPNICASAKPPASTFNLPGIHAPQYPSPACTSPAQTLPTACPPHGDHQRAPAGTRVRLGATAVQAPTSGWSPSPPGVPEALYPSPGPSLHTSPPSPLARSLQPCGLLTAPPTGQARCCPRAFVQALLSRLPHPWGLAQSLDHCRGSRNKAELGTPKQHHPLQGHHPTFSSERRPRPQKVKMGSRDVD